jgi:hypothetical protein
MFDHSPFLKYIKLYVIFQISLVIKYMIFITKYFE